MKIKYLQTICQRSFVDTGFGVWRAGPITAPSQLQPQ